MAPTSAAAIEGRSDQELEARKAEQEAGELEALLNSDVERLEAKAAALLGRLQQLKAAASQQQFRGSRDQSFAEMQVRLQRAQLPTLDLAPARGRAARARLLAVKERLDAAAAIRTAVHSFGEELNALSWQLGNDEATLLRTQKKIEEEMARQAAEDKRQAVEAQRRKAEAQRLAADSPTKPLLGTQPWTTQSQEQAPSRRRVRVRMQAAIDLESDSNFYTGFSTNISEGGIFVAAVHMPPKESVVELHFSLPNGKRLNVWGQVRWSREVNDQTPDIFPGVGVQFVDLSPAAQAEIRDFVSEREPLFFPD